MSTRQPSRSPEEQPSGLVPSRLPPTPWVDAIDADERQVAALLRVQSGGLSGAQSRERRQHMRQIYREGRVLLTINPKSSFLCETLRVMPFDISSEGMRFVHGGFVFPETACEVYLLTLDAQIKRVGGEVIRCDLLTTSLYDIGVRFKVPIPIEQILDESEIMPYGQCTGNNGKRGG